MNITIKFNILELVSVLNFIFPTTIPLGFHVETTWKRSFPRRFNVESTCCVCCSSDFFLFFLSDNYFHHSCLKFICLSRSRKLIPVSPSYPCICPSFLKKCLTSSFQKFSRTAASSLCQIIVKSSFSCNLIQFVYSKSDLFSRSSFQLLPPTHSKSSRSKVFCKKDGLKNVSKFTGKHLWRSLFLTAGWLSKTQDPVKTQDPDTLSLQLY